MNTGQVHLIRDELYQTRVEAIKSGFTPKGLKLITKLIKLEIKLADEKKRVKQMELGARGFLKG